MAARVHRSTLAAVAAANPTGGAAQKDFRDYDLNAGATYDRVDTGTVPTTPFAIELDLAALRNFGVTITVGGVARTKVRYGTQASGQVGVDFVNGRIQFYSGDAGGSYSVTYRGRGSVITATDMNILQNEIAYLRTAAATFVVGPSSATDNAAMRYDGTTGKLAQNSLLIIADNGNTSTVGTLSASNLSGTNTGDLTLSGAAALALATITSQQFSLDVQSAYTFLAGPISGSPAAPTFRTITADDLADVDFAASGDVTASGLTMATNKLLGRDTVSTGAIEELGVSGGLSISGGNLTISGPVAVTAGGTGISATSQGDIFYSDANNSIVTLTKNASATRYLSNTGTSNNPAWAQVNLANGVTGTLGVGSGGTGGTATPTNGYYAKGNGSAYTFVDLLGTTNSWTAPQTMGAAAWINFTPSTTQVISAVGNTILANAGTVNLSNVTGNLTLTSTPTIADGADGQDLVIHNLLASTGRVVLQAESGLAGSNLYLGAASRALQAGGMIHLRFIAAESRWVEIAFLASTS